MPLAGVFGRYFDAEGRAVGGSAVLRIREVSGERLELIRLRGTQASTEKEMASLRALLEASPTPVWIRNAEGKLVFVNGAYAAAVEAKDPAEAVARGLELLDQSARAEAAQALARGVTWRASSSGRHAGWRAGNAGVDGHRQA
jgi:PAS domain-containing protein